VWYGVPAAAAAALDAAMRDALPHLFDKDHLLLHKLITMLSTLLRLTGCLLAAAASCATGGCCCCCCCQVFVSVL
jgi:hypothetical protein